MQYGSDAVSRTRSPPPSSGPRLTYSPFANALDPILSTVANSSLAAKEWQRRIDLPATKGTVAELLLADACVDLNQAPVVFSTTSVGHLESLVQAAYDPGMRSRVPEFRKWIADSINVPKPVIHR